MSEQSDYDSLAMGILDVVSALQAAVQAPPRPSGAEMSRSQLAILRYLARNGPSKMRDLAAGLDVTPATMTAPIKLLARTGLVERQHDDTDWRSVRVNITEAGRAAQGGADASRSQLVASALATLSAEHRALLMVSLPAMRALAAAVHSR
ncbi:MAG TPA: MarR family transcriptional regulator [Chloroflexota bacterium]|nr:MarR family transcriptional regulator [Chloroflexota bacterium]